MDMFYGFLTFILLGQIIKSINIITIAIITIVIIVFLFFIILIVGIIPLLNENDAVSANQGYDTYGCSFSDNDSLASLVAVEMKAELLILLTDVYGVYDRPPSDKDATIIDVFRESTAFEVGQKSLQGRGGE